MTNPNTPAPTPVSEAAKAADTSIGPEITLMLHEQFGWPPMILFDRVARAIERTALAQRDAEIAELRQAVIDLNNICREGAQLRDDQVASLTAQLDEAKSIIESAVHDVDEGTPANPRIVGENLHIECQQVLITADWYDEATAFIDAAKSQAKKDRLDTLGRVLDAARKFCEAHESDYWDTRDSSSPDLDVEFIALYEAVFQGAAKSQAGTAQAEPEQRKV